MTLQIPNEEHFRKRLEIEARAQGCRYTQIPDVHKAAYAIAKRTGGHVPVYKRPCDGVFSCAVGMAFVELKHQNGKLKPHQIEHLRAERELHGRAYVLRAKEMKCKGLVFTIELETGAVIFAASNIETVILRLVGLIIAAQAGKNAERQNGEGK